MRPVFPGFWATILWDKWDWREVGLGYDVGRMGYGTDGIWDGWDGGDGWEWEKWDGWDLGAFDGMASRG